MSGEHFKIDDPVELPNGRLVCQPHQLTVCGKCCVDYSFMEDEDSDNEPEDSDGDEPLTEEEMKAFRERLIAKKGCACFLPLYGNGCKNCDPKLKEKKDTTETEAGKGDTAESNSKEGGTVSGKSA